ncbi:MAG: universal stress protein [Crocinitomicaceae bacterium]|nr:universal stress protein [Crocinitomicaceae bacterium]
MKKILVPVDFTPCSKSALNYALGIAKNTNTEVHLIHTIEMDYSFTGGSVAGARLFDVDMEERPIHQIKEVFEQADQLLVDLLNEEQQKLNYQTHVLEGDLIGEILAYSKENKIDLIVMGSHGDRGVNNVLLGSHAQKMVRFSEIPVIVVKENAGTAGFDKIVYTSDFKEEELNQSLDYVKTIAKFYKSDLHLLYINTPNKFEESDVVDTRIEKMIDQHKLENATHSTFNATWVDEGIVKFIKKNKADLLVINTHGYKGIRKIFHHSVAESVVNAIDIPVMIVTRH